MQRHDVYIDVEATLYLRHVPAGIMLINYMQVILF